MLTNNDALLIVDVQADFLPGGALAVPQGAKVIAVLNAMIDTFATAGLPVFASRDWHPPDHCSFNEQGGPWPPHCIAGTPGAEIDSSLHLPDGTRFFDKATMPDKDAYSAFEDTDLNATLKQNDVTRLFVGGLATEYCVLNTSADAVRNGFEVFILKDAIRAIDPVDGQRAIESLCEMGVTVVDSNEILDEQH